MKNSTKPTIRFSRVVFILVIVFVLYTNTVAQSLSNGSIDFIFQPTNGSTQFALWVENENGEYIATVFLTNFIGRNGGGNRTSDPDIDLSTGNRLSAQPVWSFKRGVIDTTFGIENYYPPAETYPSYPDDIDAVSGATPGSSVQRKTWQLPNLQHGIYNCWISANESFDINAYHNYSFYRGQPSVVWSATVQISADPDSVQVLDYTGYGSTDGSNGDLHAPDATITTAAELLDDMGGYKFKVVFTPLEAPVSAEDNHTYSSQGHSFILNRNYPNPFNSSTSITYSVLKPGLITIKIYNLPGEEIQTLVNEFHAIGDYSIDFNSNNLPNGFYFCNLRCGNDLTDTRMMLLCN